MKESGIGVPFLQMQHPSVDSTPTSQQSHPASNKIFLLVRFALVGSISLQALQMKVLILLHTLAAQIAFQILLHCE